MEDATKDVVSDGVIDLYYSNLEYANITPKSFHKLYIRHNLVEDKGLVSIVTSESLTEYGIYILDSNVIYDGQDKISISIYNFGPKPYVIENKDVICTLILNKFEEEVDD